MMNYRQLLAFCKGLKPAELDMPVQVGTATCVATVNRAHHIKKSEAPDLGSNTLILDTI